MTARIAFKPFARALLWCAAILLFLLFVPIERSKADTERPTMLLDENQQALLLFDYNRFSEGGQFFWLFQDEIRFIHCKNTSYYLSSKRTRIGGNQHYAWRIGGEAVRYLSEAPLLNEIMSSNPPHRTYSFLQNNGYIVFEFTLEQATFRFNDGTGSTVLGNIRKPEQLGDNPFFGVRNIVYDGDDLVAMIIVQPDILPILCVYEISTGEYELVKDLDVKMMAPFKSGEVLIYHEGAIKPYALKAKSMGPAMTYADEPFDMSARSFAFDQQTETLYYLLDGDLYRLRSDGKAECIVIAPTYYGDPTWIPAGPHKRRIWRVLPLSNGQLAYLLSDDVYIVNPTPLEEPAESLILSTSYSNALAYYQLMHPHLSIINHSNNIPIVRSDVGYPIADVYQSVSNRRSLRDYYREGCAMALLEIPSVMSSHESYIPAAQEALSYEGKPIGVPISMTINPWFINQGKWVEYGLPEPPKTAEELFDIIDVWAEKYAEKYPDDYLLGDEDVWTFSTCVLYLLHEQYMLERTVDGEPLRFDTDLFLSLLKRAFELPELSTNWDGEDGTYPLLYGSNYSVFYNTLAEIGNIVLTDGDEIISMGNEYVPIMPVSMTDNGNAKLGAVMNVLFIHPDARNLEQAQGYLAFVATHPELFQDDLAFMLSPDKNEIQVEREDIVRFYRQHIDDVSFASYALFGFSMKNETVITLYKPDAFYFVNTEQNKEEAIQRVAERLNHISHIDAFD